MRQLISDQNKLYLVQQIMIRIERIQEVETGEKKFKIFIFPLSCGYTLFMINSQLFFSIPYDRDLIKPIYLIQIIQIIFKALMENQTITLSKEQKQVNKQITHHIERYSYLRDWSELALWLTKLKNILTDYKGIIVDKSTVLKKLSTSLNASLPVALHQSTLQIYQILFNKFITVQNLQFVCLGLFSFFSAANMKCKVKLVEMFKAFLPKYGKQIKIMSTGLIITLLPALNEMHDHLVKETNDLLDWLNTSDNYGHELFVQSVWIAILRSTNCRIAGLKLISQKLGKVDNDQENQDEDNFWNETIKQGSKNDENNSKVENESVIKKVDVKQYCPHISTLVTNALIACIQDQNILVVKTGLDFLYKYLPLKNEILQKQSKMKLAYSLIWLLSKRDMGVTRKINFWLFGKLDSKNKFVINEKNLDFIICPIIHFLRKDCSLQPLKIIFNLFNEHQDLPTLTMQKLTKQIVAFCTRQQVDNEAIKIVQRLLDKIHYELSVLSNSLGQGLIDAVIGKDFRQAEHILQLTVYLVRKILRPNEIKIIIFEIIKTIIKSYQLTGWEDRDYMKSSLNVTLQLIDSYKQNLKQKKEESSEGNELKLHIKLYSNLVEKLKVEEGDSYEQQVQLICKAQVKLYEIFDIYQVQWVNTLQQNVFLKSPQYYLTPIQIIGEALQNKGRLKDELISRVQNNDKNCIKISIIKLWSIMSFGHLHYRIIPLLLRLVKYFPHFFSNTLLYDFEANVEMAITKFSVFWHLSPKYPAVVSHQHLSEVCKPGFFQMLNFLDNGNPLVKYNTKIWINQCFPNFNRVIDPLLQIILKPAGCWYRTFKGQYVYAIEPETQKTINCLRYLHSIIKHTEVKFFKFATKPLTMHIRPYFEIFKGKQKLQKLQSQNNAQSTYLTVIFEIVVRYLGTKYVNIISENPGLDIICCQLLQTIVKKIEDPQLCIKYVYENMQHIFLSLHFATCNEQHILQIQLLNLIDSIFFNSQLKKSTDVKKLKSIISSTYFTKTIMQGLNTQFPYIKQRFVQFINKSIVLFLDYYNNCSELISQILNNYLSKIMLVHSHKLQSSQHKDIEISKRNSQILILFGGVTELLSYFLNLSVKPFEKEKNHGEPDSGVFSLYTWKSFVSLRIQRKSIETNKGRRNAEEISKLMPNQLQQLLLTMTSCWTLSDLVSQYKISLEGLSEFDFQQFHTFNKNFYQTFRKYETQESVETYIINLLRVLINKYPKQTMNSMIKNWTSAVTVQQKIKIIEILNLTSIPIQHFFTILSETLNEEKLHKKRKSVHLIVEPTIEQQILHFCQFFTHYSFQNVSVFQAFNLLNIWSAFLRFIRLFQNSRSVLTLYSLIQLIFIFIQKHNPKQILKDQRLKKDWLSILNSFQQLVHICNGKIKISSGIEGHPQIHHFLPLPTSVFEVYMSELGKIEQAKAPFMFFNDLTSQKVVMNTRIYGFLILKRLVIHFLQTFYGDTEANLVKKARQIFTLVLAVVEDKSQNTMFIDCASQVAMSIIQKRHSFAKQLKNDVLEIFNKDDFFICSSKTLHCWVRIIDLIIDNNKDHDIFTQYLEKVSLVSSIFSSYNLQTKKKIKSFERICFILYAGKKDKYNEKAHLLIDKIIDVIKNAEAPQPVLILIFFCIRILILRTSPERLTKLLGNLWQLIMFLLTSIFKKNVEALKQKNSLNLLWAALKLIEMVSIMELNEFHPHQWIFFYDYIGVNFESSISQEGSLLDPKVKPLISRYLPSSIKPYKQDVQQASSVGHLIIKEDKIDDIDLLKTKALLLSSYLIRNNQCKMKFDMRQIQALIENDFLNLDEFIFKFK